METASTYSAFVSYSQAADAALAPRLQSALERFATPWYRGRALRVFRDTTNLSLAPELWPEIERALAMSDFLLFLASPESARSRWVKKELMYWLATKGPSRLLLIVTAGAIKWNDATQDFDAIMSPSVPECLFGAFKSEPLYLDFTSITPSRQTLDDAEFADHIASIAAPLRGITKDSLVGAHIRYIRRTRRVIAAVVVALIALTLLAIAAAIVADRESRRAVEAEDDAKKKHHQATQNLAQSYLDSGRSDITAGNVAAATFSFWKGYESAAPDSDLRYSARYLLSGWSRSLGMPLHHDAGVYSCALSRSGTEFACGTTSGRLYLWKLPLTAPGALVCEHGKSTVLAVAFNDDNSRVATGGHDGQVRVWSTKTLEEIGRPLTHSGPVWSLVFQPNGDALLSGCQDGIARLWDIKTGTLRCPPVKHDGPVRVVSFNALGTVAASGYSNAATWSCADGTRLSDGYRHNGEMSTLAFTRDGSRVLSTAFDGTACLWDARTGRPTAPLIKTGGQILSAELNSRSTQVVIGERKQARVWALDSGMPMAWSMRHEGEVKSVQFSADDTMVATASYDGRARLWDATNGRLLSDSIRHDGFVMRALFTPDQKTLITASADRSARLWSIGGLLPQWINVDSRCDCMCVAFDASRNIIAGIQNESVRFIDAETGTEKGRPLKHPQMVRAVTFSSDGTMCATACIDKKARIWNVKARTLITESLLHDDVVEAVAFSQDGSLLATGSWDKSVRIWDVSTRAAIGKSIVHQKIVSCVRFIPGSRKVITTSGGQLSVWDVESEPRLIQSAQHSEAVYCIETSRDGQWLATGGSDGTVKVWNTVDLSLKGQPFKHGQNKSVHSVSLSPNGRVMFSACNDGTGVLWDVFTRQKICADLPHGMPVLKGVFINDGRRLATACQDNKIRCWRVPVPIKDDPASVAVSIQMRTGLMADANGNRIEMSHNEATKLLGRSMNFADVDE